MPDTQRRLPSPNMDNSKHEKDHLQNSARPDLYDSFARIDGTEAHLGRKGVAGQKEVAEQKKDQRLGETSPDSFSVPMRQIGSLPFSVTQGLMECLDGYGRSTFLYNFVLILTPIFM
jgi:hypothetical protein